MKKAFHTARWAASVLASFAMIPAASAQILRPVPPAGGGPAPLPGTNCTVEVLNLNGIVYPDGQMAVFNVPSGQGPVRMRATCIDPFGATLNGQSELVTPSPNEDVISTGFVDFGSDVPIAARLEMMPSEIDLSGLGTTLQLAVKSMFADQTSGDMTPASSGTTYRTSNAAVATVGKDGLITAMGNGTAVISALNEGALGVAAVNVRSAALVSLDVVPSQISLSINKAFQLPRVTLKTSGVLADNAIIDLTSASSGIMYDSSNAGVAAVGPDGTMVAVSGGTADITVRDTLSGIQTVVPVTTTVFDPQPIGAYKIAGFAWNCDIDGNLVYVAADTGGLQIVQALSGKTVGKLAFLGQKAFDVRLRGKLAAVALGPDGFALVDVNNAVLPLLLSTTSTGGDVRDLAVSGNLLYAASNTNLPVYDITDPALPVAAGSYAMGANVKAVAADTSRNFAVVLTDKPALSVVTLGGAPPWPEVALPAAQQGADDVILFGTSAYVANGKDGIREVDVIDPANPAVKASSTLSFSATGIALRQTPDGTLVAAADYFFVNAVPLFDTNLQNTFNIDFTTFPDVVQYDANSIDIALGDGFGVVAVGGAGIQVFKTQEINDNAGIAPTVSLTSPMTGSTPIAGDPVFAEATATDDIGVGFVEFVLDNMTTVGGSTEAPFTATFPAPSACTTHVLHAQATDFWGNVGMSLPVTLKVKCDDGQPCAGNIDCASDLCGSGICQPCSAGDFPSCAALRESCPNAVSGTYSLDPDGAGPLGAFPAYCEMRVAGGGWTLAAKFTNQDAKNWVTTPSAWASNVSYGNAADLSAGQDAKSPAYSTIAANDILLSDTDSLSSDLYVQTAMDCVGGQTLSQFFGAAVTTHYPCGSVHSFKKCATINNYVPGWTLEPNWPPPPDDQDETSSYYSLNNGFVHIAASDNCDSFGMMTFYEMDPAHTILPGDIEADLGLAPSDVPTTPWLLQASSGALQDIGGPTSCADDDMQCQADYPQTVLMFVRGPTTPADAPSCNAIKQTLPGAADGVYTIDPDGPGGPTPPFNAYCDMTTDGGGWTLIFNQNPTFDPTADGDPLYADPNANGTSLAYSTLRVTADVMFDANDINIAGPTDYLMRTIVTGIQPAAVGRTLKKMMTTSQYYLDAADNSNIVNSTPLGGDCTSIMTWGDWTAAACSTAFITLHDGAFAIGHNFGNAAGWPQAPNFSGNWWPDNFRIWIR